MDKRFKILMVHNHYQILGGEDTVVANEMEMLKEHGHEVLLYSRHNKELRSGNLLQKICLPLTTIFSLKTYREVRKIIKRERIDIVHVHNTLSLISPSVYYAAFSCKVPVVQTIHNFRLLCPGATFYRDGHICEDCVEKGLKCAVRHSCYRNSRIQTLACVITLKIHRALRTYQRLNYICLTEFNKKKLLTLKQINPKNVYVKPNLAEASKEIIPFCQRKDQFLFAGRLDGLKGIKVLLRAWKMIDTQGAFLIICGTGPLEEWCHRFIKENGLNNVKMMGLLPNEEVRQMIAESKAMILPTQWYEGFPMTIAEAFAVETPVIGSDLGNVGDLIKDGRNGWKFQAESSEELGECIRNVRKLKKYEFKSGVDTGMRGYERLKRIYMEIKK